MSEQEARRKYSLEEMDEMRRSLRVCMKDSRRFDMQYTFDHDGNCLGGSGWAHGDGCEKDLDAIIENLLRTHLLNGTEPAELARQAEAHLVSESIHKALDVVGQRRRKMLPEPADCPYIRLLKQHDKYRNYDEALALLREAGDALFDEMDRERNPFEPDNQTRRFYRLKEKCARIDAFLAKENSNG